MGSRDTSQKQVLMSDMDYLFGHRKVIFVRYPPTFTVQNIVRLLDWAKTWDVVSLHHDGCLVKAVIKPNYVKHFRHDNDKYAVMHTVLNVPDPSDPESYPYAYEVENAIYES